MSKYTHKEFPEITLQSSDGPYTGDTTIMWYDKTTKTHISIPAHQLFWQLSCLVNNKIALQMNWRKQPELYKFFSQLARDIEGIGTLLTKPENCSPAAKGNLEHFHRRAMGDSTGW